MAAAPLPDIVAAEAAGATLVGGALLIWTGDAAARLALPATPPSWAIMRLVAVIWNTTAGFVVAITPLALAFRYTQFAMRATAS